MARANLTVADDLREAFLRAQSGSVRYVKASIVDESITFGGESPASADVGADFDALPAALADSEPCFVLFCLDVAPGGEAGNALPWLLVAWVPETSQVRLKMLYSSSREDLKRALGLNYFVGEYGCTEKSELVWADYQESQRATAAADAPLTETETLERAERTMERDSNIKSTAMGVIPFSMTDALLAQLEAFRDGGVNWVSISLDTANETMNVDAAEALNAEAPLAGRVNPDEPRYLLLTYPRRADGAAGASRLFFFSCPEGAPIRAKMMYSTCKATLLSMTEPMGLAFDSMQEIRAPDEIDETIASEMQQGGAGAAAAAEAPKVISRPARPGRGRARLTRKK